jgi:hypothetical protein
MKIIILGTLFILFFAGCTQDSKKLDKEECKKLGYKYATENRLNYRTGKYELKFICLNIIK